MISPKLTARRQEKILATLSKRARKLFDRIRDENRWYRSYSPKTPKAMEELVKAGLVMESGRVNVITLAYVPVKGFKPMRMEEWDRH